MIDPCLRAFSLVAIFAIAFLNASEPGLTDTASASPAPTHSAAPAGVLVPGGTGVSVSLTEPLSSGTANVGDQIGIIVKKEVDASGFVVIAAGAQGHATVTSAEHAAGNGSGGKLALTIDWVYSADGGKIALSQTNHAAENGDQKGAASTATILSYVLLGPLGFFAHNFVRGRDVTIGTDKTFSVFVDHDVHVRTSQLASSGNAQGFDQ